MHGMMIRERIVDITRPPITVVASGARASLPRPTGGAVCIAARGDLHVPERHLLDLLLDLLVHPERHDARQYEGAHRGLAQPVLPLDLGRSLAHADRRHLAEPHGLAAAVYDDPADDH